jgi:hypothetical protein
MCQIGAVQVVLCCPSGAVLSKWCCPVQVVLPCPSGAVLSKWFHKMNVSMKGLIFLPIFFGQIDRVFE